MWIGSPFVFICSNILICSGFSFLSIWFLFAVIWRFADDLVVFPRLFSDCFSSFCPVTLLWSYFPPAGREGHQEKWLLWCTDLEHYNSRDTGTLKISMFILKLSCFDCFLPRGDVFRKILIGNWNHSDPNYETLTHIMKNVECLLIHSLIQWILLSTCHT